MEYTVPTLEESIENDIQVQYYPHGRIPWKIGIPDNHSNYNLIQWYRDGFNRGLEIYCKMAWSIDSVFYNRSNFIFLRSRY